MTAALSAQFGRRAKTNTGPCADAHKCAPWAALLAGTPIGVVSEALAEPRTERRTEPRSGVTKAWAAAHYT